MLRGRRVCYEETATPKDGREESPLHRVLPSPAVAEDTSKTSSEQEVGGGFRNRVGGRRRSRRSRCCIKPHVVNVYLTVAACDGNTYN